jgi:hypothetical protein
MERVLEYHQNNPDTFFTPPIGNLENQMTLKDVYTLARMGESLTLDDFDQFPYQLTGQDFTVRRYEVIGADTVFVAVSDDGSLATAELWSRRTLDMSNTVDLRDGFAAIAEYLNPLKLLIDISVDDSYGYYGEAEMDMFFEDDYFRSESRYYLNTSRSDSIFVVFDYGERLPIKQALAERRVTVENLVAAGLSDVRMIPIDNPLGGEFVILHHLYTFSLNGEAFYPSKSFMYVVSDSGFAVYYDIDELGLIMNWYGFESEAEGLSQAVDPEDIITIAAGNYVSDWVLADAGVISGVGWAFSSHTPVEFVVK